MFMTRYVVSYSGLEGIERGSTVLLYFLNSVGGGAWPLLVGGLPCQADSDNERDLYWLISRCVIKL